MALPLAVLLKASKVPEAQASSIMDEYSDHCKNADSENARSNRNTLATRYHLEPGSDDIRKSCFKIRKEMGYDFCDCSNCPIEIANTVREEEPNTSPEDKPDEPSETEPGLTPAILAKAKEIIASGKALDYIAEAFKTLHYGDVEINQVISLAVGCQSITNVQGVQPTTTGEAGQGKTAAVRACCHLLPRAYMMESGFSNKALFYSDLGPGMVIFSDDTALTPELNDVVKRSMSNFQSDTEYKTLDASREPVTLIIPRRTVFLFTSVDTQGDQQLADRQYPISISNTPESNEGYIRWRNRKDVTGEEDYPVNEQVLVCRAIYGSIKRKLFRVTVPFADFISFTEKNKRRAMRYFMDFIKAVAVYHYPDRNPSAPGEDGIITLTATVEDMEEAVEYFASNKDIRKHSLTKDELALWQFISANVHDDGEILETELYEKWVKRTRDTYNNFYRKLHGRKDRGTRGLLDKVPGLTVGKISKHEYETKIATGYMGECMTSKPTQSRPLNLIRCTSSPSLEIYETFYNFDEKGWESQCKAPTISQ